MENWFIHIRNMHTNTHTNTLHGKWGYNVSNFSVNFARCVRNNRRARFGFRRACVCVCIWLCEVSSVWRLRSGSAAVSVLHAGRKLEVGDTNIVIAAVEEDVSLRGRGAQREGVR